MVAVNRFRPQLKPSFMLGVRAWKSAPL